MDFLALLFVQVLFAIASLALISIGLAIVFGMLRVINFAHGEFLMMGGFAFVLLVNAGVNFWLAMFILAPLCVGVIGLIIERLVIRHLYGRIIDTVLATWGISLLLVGLASTFIGYYQKGVTPPFGPIQIGAYSEGWYTIFVIVVAALLLGGIYLFLKKTRMGLIARATMQEPEMASAIGIARERVYAVTFACGAAISGFAGAVMAPITGVVPTSGVTYIAKSFITVISGGPSVIAGTASASGLFGSISQITSIFTRPVIGEAMLLLSAVVLLRFFPTGLTGRILRR